MPRAAVLLPARNAEATVWAAATSILRQTERDLELVLVEDGSCDGTAALLERLMERDRRVKVLRGPGEGIARALDRGLEQCDAEVVVRMDADDVAHPERVESLLDALDRDPSLAAVGSQVRLFPRRTVREGMVRYASWLNGLVTKELVRRDLFVEAPLVHPASAIRRADLERLGGWRDGDFPEDYDLWLRLAAAGRELTNLPRALLSWRESAGRLTRTDPRYERKRHIELKCTHLARTFLSQTAEVAIWGAGETGRAFARDLKRLGIGTANFIDVDPKKIGRMTLGARVLGMGDLRRVRGQKILVAVGAKGARDLIRAELTRCGFLEVRDYVVVS